MVSFFKYSQNNNSNLTLRNSLIFSIYNKNINKKIYFKSNNTIKGSYIDPVLNDSIYIASNGLKKNVSFRKNEINYKKNITSKNFVSYFSQLEDNFLISNIYPNKYLNDLIIKSFQDQKVLTNWNTNTLTANSGNYNLKDVSVLDNSQNIFIKNTFKKFYFINKFGFLFQLNKKLIQRKIFTGLFYIFPKHIKENFKNLFSLKYLLLNFYSHLKITNKNKNLIKQNIILYTLFLNFVKYKINTYSNTVKLKFRKSNWLLNKYFNQYAKPLNNMLNFLYLINVKYLKYDNLNFLLNNLLYYNNSTSNKFLWNNFISEFETLDNTKKIVILKQFLLQINLTSHQNVTFNSSKLLYNYLIGKSQFFFNHLYQNNFNLKFIKSKILFTNFLNLLALQFRINKSNKNLISNQIYETNLLDYTRYFEDINSQTNKFYINYNFVKLNRKNYFSNIFNLSQSMNYNTQEINYLNTLNNLLLKKIIVKFKFLKRRILKKEKNKRNLQQKFQVLKYKKLSIFNPN